MERCYFFSLMLGRYGSGLLFSILEWQYLCLCSTVYLWLRDGCGFQQKMCCCLSLPRPWYHPTVLGGHGSKHVWQLLIYPALMQSPLLVAALMRTVKSLFISLLYARSQLHWTLFRNVSGYSFSFRGFVLPLPYFHPASLVKELGKHVSQYVVIVVRLEIQVSVYVSRLPVHSNFKGFIILSEEGVQKW